MRVLAALFFILFFPVTVFIASFLYGGVTPLSLKEALVKAEIYEKIPQSVNKLMESEETEEAPDPFMTSILSKLNSSYLQTKTEKLIDDTHEYVRNNGTAPTLSFSDIKEDILAENPEIMAMVNDATREMENMDTSEMQGMDVKQMKEFINNDFSIPLGEHLVQIKNTYTFLTFSLPILIILMLVSLVILILFSPSLKSKFKWVGIVLLLSAINGVIWVIGGAVLQKFLTTTLVSFNNEVVVIVTPAIEHILSVFVEKYKWYQLIVSGVAIILGIVLLVLSKTSSNGATPALAKVKKAPQKKK